MIYHGFHTHVNTPVIIIFHDSARIRIHISIYGFMGDHTSGPVRTLCGLFIEG